MKHHHIVFAAVLTFAHAPILAASSSGKVVQVERKGVSNAVIADVQLPENLDLKGNHMLRMRKIRIAPGGMLSIHSHDDRPSVSYVLEGKLTEVIGGDGEESHIISAGRAYSSFKTTHALYNKTNSDVIFLEIDLFQPVDRRDSQPSADQK